MKQTPANSVHLFNIPSTYINVDMNLNIKILCMAKISVLFFFNTFTIKCNASMCRFCRHSHFLNIVTCTM